MYKRLWFWDNGPMGYTGSDPNPASQNIYWKYNLKFWYGGVHLKTFYKTLKISMENLAKCKKAYWAAKSNAKQRGKEWKFTQEEWIGWWEERLGANWLEKRGTRNGSSYVMGRIGDTGPYSPRKHKMHYQ